METTSEVTSSPWVGSFEAAFDLFFLFRLFMAGIVIDLAGNQQPWMSRIKTLVKITVAVLVAIGLFLAIRSAVDSWNTQSAAIQLSLQDLQSEIDSETNPEQRIALQTQADQLASQIPSMSNLRWNTLFLAGVLYAAGLLPSAAVLRINCGLFGSTPRWSTATAAQLLGHLGKYVPGKAMVVVIRAGVLSRDKVGLLAATTGIFAETFLMMAMGAAIACAVTWFMPVPSWVILSAMAMSVLAFTPTLPPVMRRIIQRMGKTSSLDTARIDWRWAGKTWVLTAISWGLIGASFSAVVASIPGANDLPSLTGLFAVSTAAIGLALVAGFASLLPGGAGVRELVLYTILGIAVDPAQAIFAAIAARIVFLIVEIFFGTLSWIWLKLEQRKSIKLYSSDFAKNEQP